MSQCHSRFTAEGWTVRTVGSSRVISQCFTAEGRTVGKGGLFKGHATVPHPLHCRRVDCGNGGFSRVMSWCCTRFTAEGWTVGDVGFPKGHVTVLHPLHRRRVDSGTRWVPQGSCHSAAPNLLQKGAHLTISPKPNLKVRLAFDKTSTFVQV